MKYKAYYYYINYKIWNSVKRTVFIINKIINFFYPLLYLNQVTPPEIVTPIILETPNTSEVKKLILTF